jgi:hypothetical protein
MTAHESIQSGASSKAGGPYEASSIIVWFPDMSCMGCLFCCFAGFGKRGGREGNGEGWD